MNVSVIGSRGLSNKLAKKGTSSDITLYNTSFQGRHYTFVEPESYPEKVQTLFQAINMSQFTIFYITGEIQKQALGECILAIDMLKKPGIIVLDSFDENELKPFLKGTALENFPVAACNTPEIMSALSGAEIPEIEGKTKVVIDHSFTVKSVGAIALGTVVSGEIKKHDTLTLYPLGKSVSIKSIQIHDKESEKGSCNDRVGLSIKGAEVPDMPRGSVVAESIRCVKELNVTFSKNRFFAEEVPKSVMCIAGLQYASAVMENGKLVFSREIAFDGEEIILLAPDKKMRIVGVARAQ